jgi:hypothetical protein
MLTRAEADTRVALGAAFLDRKQPGWEREIDITTLRLCDDGNCILAQLSVPQTRVYSLSAMKFGLSPDGQRTIDLGFFTHTWSDYIALQDAWIAAIADRLHPDRPHDEELVESPAPSGDQ